MTESLRFSEQMIWHDLIEPALFTRGNLDTVCHYDLARLVMDLVETIALDVHPAAAHLPTAGRYHPGGPYLAVDTLCGLLRTAELLLALSDPVAARQAHDWAERLQSRFSAPPEVTS